MNTDKRTGGFPLGDRGATSMAMAAAGLTLAAGLEICQPQTDNQVDPVAIETEIPGELQVIEVSQQPYTVEVQRGDADADTPLVLQAEGDEQWSMSDKGESALAPSVPQLVSTDDVADVLKTKYSL